MLKLNTDGSWAEGASDRSVAAVYRDSSGAMVAGFANSVRAAFALTANSCLLEKPGQFLLPDASGEVKTDCGFVAELISDKEESPHGPCVR
ncbi:hypothetical protein NL676_019029 [Syzygium grande]|nr:hypothetical protein NL676_019029 [Syzygium grande]